MNMMPHFKHNQQSMTSREIADLCDKRHDHVCRDIDKLNTTYEKIGLPKIGEGYYTHQSTGNQQHREFILNKEQSTDLVTGYKPELRIKINRRWSELEQQLNQPTELSRMDLIQLAFAAEQENQALKDHVAELEPKALVMDTIAETTNTYTIRDSAKTIGIPESKLIDFMISKHWVYRENSRHRRLCAYGQRINQKVMINKVSKVIACEDGDKAFTQARITAFGLTRLTALVAAAGLLR